MNSVRPFAAAVVALLAAQAMARGDTIAIRSASFENGVYIDNHVPKDWGRNDGAGHGWVWAPSGYGRPHVVVMNADADGSGNQRDDVTWQDLNLPLQPGTRYTLTFDWLAMRTGPGSGTAALVLINADAHNNGNGTVNGAIPAGDIASGAASIGLSTATAEAWNTGRVRFSTPRTISSTLDIGIRFTRSGGGFRLVLDNVALDATPLPTGATLMVR